MAMKLIKKSADYKIFVRGDDRYAVQDSNGRSVNGEEKVRILVEEELIKVAVPSAPKAAEEDDAQTEAVVEEAAEEAAEEPAAEAVDPEPEASAPEDPLRQLRKPQSLRRQMTRQQQTRPRWLKRQRQTMQRRRRSNTPHRTADELEPADAGFFMRTLGVKRVGSFQSARPLARAPLMI